LYAAFGGLYITFRFKKIDKKLKRKVMYNIGRKRIIKTIQWNACDKRQWK